MKKLLYKLSLIMLFVNVFFQTAFSVESISPYPGDVADPGYTITSDFGPRKVANSTFHKGIDYRRGQTDEVALLKDGVVVDIHRNQDNPLILKIKTPKPSAQNENADSTYYLRYLHMFNDKAIPQGGLIVGRFVLAKPTNATVNQLAIIALAAKPGGGYYDDRAEYIICRIPKLNVRKTTTTNYKTADGTKDAETIDAIQTSVNTQIGIGGISGKVSVDNSHVHIDWATSDNSNYTDIRNPLYLVQHANSNSLCEVYDKDNKQWPDNSTCNVMTKDADTKFLKIKLNTGAENTSASGLDLDSIELYVDQRDNAHLLTRWFYRGRTFAEDQSSNLDIWITLKDKDKDGVYVDGTCGIEYFGSYPMSMGKIELGDRLK